MATFTEKRGDAVGKGVFLIGLGILFFTHYWWPGILYVILAAIFARACFLGKIKDLSVALLIFVLLALIWYYPVDQTYIVPAILILLGLFYIMRELSYSPKEPPLPPAKSDKG